MYSIIKEDPVPFLGIGSSLAKYFIVLINQLMCKGFNAKYKTLTLQ